jgi:Na+-translocating ferredoxin:NAD+ oxidoreductase RnfE subunit
VPYVTGNVTLMLVFITVFNFVEMLIFNFLFGIWESFYVNVSCLRVNCLSVRCANANVVCTDVDISSASGVICYTSEERSVGKITSMQF